MVGDRMKSPFSVSKKLKIYVDNYDDLCDPDDIGSHPNELSEGIGLSTWEWEGMGMRGWELE